MYTWSLFSSLLACTFLLALMALGMASYVGVEDYVTVLTGAFMAFLTPSLCWTLVIVWWFATVQFSQFSNVRLNQAEYLRKKAELHAARPLPLQVASAVLTCPYTMVAGVALIWFLDKLADKGNQNTCTDACRVDTDVCRDCSIGSNSLQVHEGFESVASSVKGFLALMVMVSSLRIFHMLYFEIRAKWEGTIDRMSARSCCDMFWFVTKFVYLLAATIAALVIMLQLGLDDVVDKDSVLPFTKFVTMTILGMVYFPFGIRGVVHSVHKELGAYKETKVDFLRRKQKREEVKKQAGDLFKSPQESPTAPARLMI